MTGSSKPNPKSQTAKILGAADGVVDASFLNGANAHFLDQILHDYQTNPESVDPSWRALFDRLPDIGTASARVNGQQGAGQFTTQGMNGAATNGSGADQALSGRAPVSGVAAAAAGVGVTAAAAAGLAGRNGGLMHHDNIKGFDSVTAEAKQAGVLRLISQYRTRGHQLANIDPLKMTRAPELSGLTPESNGLTAEDLDTEYNTGTLAASDRMSLRDVLRVVSDVYCGPVGSEYMFMMNTGEKRWIQHRLEQFPARPAQDSESRRRLLRKITAAEGLERYLHTKYVGQKRFSLEGSECLIPLVSELIQRAGGAGSKEIVIGMAHRGRLNALVNLLGKSPSELFDEFEGKFSEENQAGDVKYHQGFSSDIDTPGGPVHLALSFNPSHLEIINPVVEGSVRARQERRGDQSRDSVVPILIHGDAAFAGQGVVMETLNMSQCRGYGTGGTIHIIVNNQIGFTTSNPLDARSTLHCTEIAKMVQAPIFHVNGDDPDAVIFVTQLAFDFRQEFKKDVVIDLVSYRRHGHNEADEPTVTQPLMYQKIREHPTTREIYARLLETEGVIGAGESDQMVIEYRDALDAGKVVAGQLVDARKAERMVDWKPYLGQIWTAPGDTRVAIDRIRSLSAELLQVPENFAVHPRVARIMADRAKMGEGEMPVDWGFSETMAYATLVQDGYYVRLSGQDSGRGTFFHRHAVLHDQNNRETYVPLRTLKSNPNSFLVINSLLSEEAVVGFEYGYSTTDPQALVIWEAQFGDFVNGAQVVIDQFISSGNAKWGRLCGLVMLLPHGQEGAGPEHSSARLERFLQLCADGNLQVCVPTTPAQMFHMLRRQMIRPFRHPLIVMTPKSLLRHKLSVSPVEELAEGTFHAVLPDDDQLNQSQVRRVVICTGKVYFDLLEKRRQREITDVALLRVEQLHPFPYDRLTKLLFEYQRVVDIVWCQEEPKNQGAWYQIRHALRRCLRADQTLAYCGRAWSASPAAGHYRLHQQQQSALVDTALGTDPIPADGSE